MFLNNPFIQTAHCLQRPHTHTTTHLSDVKAQPTRQQKGIPPPPPPSLAPVALISDMLRSPELTLVT